MLKNILIFILTILVIIFWLREEPEDGFDPNDVVIEYKCNELDDYDSPPTEVVQECKDRGLLKTSI